MIGLYPDEEEVDIELYLINHHRLLIAKSNLRYIQGAIKYYARLDGEPEIADEMESIERDFGALVREYERLVVRDVA